MKGLMYRSTIINVVCLVTTTSSFFLNNDIVDRPTLKCSDDGITIHIRTRNRFRGNLYVKGHFATPNCHQRYHGDDRGASFTVPIGDCGMQRVRKSRPHGVMYMLIVVASFHPKFLTKFDNAYLIRCFYAQSDKDVQSKLEISSLHTEALDQSTVALPTCKYSLREHSVDGPLLRYAQIGERIVHRWECDDPSYGMLVKNCYVSDGGDTTVRILDSSGCPLLSPLIQGPLTYDSSQTLAYVTASAYKFPDKPQLYFQCQIQICNKNDNECDEVTPPNCRFENQITQGSSTSANNQNTSSNDRTDNNNDIGDYDDIDDGAGNGKGHPSQSEDDVIQPIRLPVVMHSSIDENKTELWKQQSSEIAPFSASEGGITTKAEEANQVQNERLIKREINRPYVTVTVEYTINKTFDVVAKTVFLGNTDFPYERIRLEGIEIKQSTTPTTVICVTSLCLQRWKYTAIAILVGLTLATLCLLVVVCIHKNKKKKALCKFYTSDYIKYYGSEPQSISLKIKPHREIESATESSWQHSESLYDKTRSLR